MSAQPQPTPAPVQHRGGMSRAAWLAQQRGRKAVLYVVALYGNSDEPPFYKIGITFNLSQRFRTLRFAGYKWRTVARYSSWQAWEVFDLEAGLHQLLAAFSYTPRLPFSGAATECYAELAPLLGGLPAGAFILKNQEILI
jgi:hypothetical protein